MRIIFFGTSGFAVPSLERVAASHEVVQCVTQPDRPQGRGLAPRPSPVKRTAQALGVPVTQPERLRAADLAEAEIGVVAAYGQLLRPEVLRRPARGCVGVHPSLLPKYRGAAPMAWAILEGERETGVTIFQLTESLDAGPILFQTRTSIGPDEDQEALAARLAREGADALGHALEQIAAGTATPVAQDDALATYAGKFTKAQGRLNWAEPADAVVRLVRALVPWPGAYTTTNGLMLKVLRARVAHPDGAQGAPGTVVRASAGELEVAAGSGSVRLMDVQPAGKRRMIMTEFLAGHPLKPGDRFGHDA